MTYELKDRDRKVLEDLEWEVCDVSDESGETCISIENYSPEGEDLCEEIYVREGETLAEAARRWADSFDVDDHVKLWIDSVGKNGVPGSVEALVTDARMIQQMMKDLAEALAEAEDETYGEVKTYAIPLVWQMYGSVLVEARTRQEAIDKALGPYFPLPADGEYVDGSCEIDPDVPIETM